MVNVVNLFEKLANELKPVTDEREANAAVALLLEPVGEEDFSILLVKRAVQQGDPWSGQMALPGGKREPYDASLKSTVEREILEETGIGLTGSSFLGVLSPVHSVPQRGLLVLPFVILLDNKPTIKLERSELVSYLWVSYEKILKSQGRATIPLVGEVSAYLVADVPVWGLTYRILSEFSKIVEASKKPT